MHINWQAEKRWQICIDRKRHIRKMFLIEWCTKSRTTNKKRVFICGRVYQIPKYMNFPAFFYIKNLYFMNSVSLLPVPCMGPNRSTAFTTIQILPWFGIGVEEGWTGCQSKGSSHISTGGFWDIDDRAHQTSSHINSRKVSKLFIDF